MFPGCCPAGHPGRFTGDPPLGVGVHGVPGTLLGLLGAGGVELTVPGTLMRGTGGVISFRSGERAPPSTRHKEVTVTVDQCGASRHSYGIPHVPCFLSGGNVPFRCSLRDSDALQSVQLVGFRCLRSGRRSVRYAEERLQNKFWTFMLSCPKQIQEPALAPAPEPVPPAGGTTSRGAGRSTETGLPPCLTLHRFGSLNPFYFRHPGGGRHQAIPSSPLIHQPGPSCIESCCTMLVLCQSRLCWDHSSARPARLAARPVCVLAFAAAASLPLPNVSTPGTRHFVQLHVGKPAGMKHRGWNIMFCCHRRSITVLQLICQKSGYPACHND